MEEEEIGVYCNKLTERQQDQDHCGIRGCGRIQKTELSDLQKSWEMGGRQKSEE